MEGLLRTFYQKTQKKPDIYGIIRRKPKLEPNPLIGNLDDEKSVKDTFDALLEIVNGMNKRMALSQDSDKPIRGIGGNPINLTECEMIKQRLAAIQSGSETGRRSETLYPGEVSA